MQTKETEMKTDFTRRALRHLLGRQIDSRAVAKIAAYGLIDSSRAEQYLLWCEVERLTARGCGRCEAMIRTGARRACSYEKVRRAFYTIEKIRRENEF